MRPTGEVSAGWSQGVIPQENETLTQTIARYGSELHCSNRCAMRHAATAAQLAQLALEESEMGWPFCQQCTRELYSIVVRHAYTWS